MRKATLIILAIIILLGAGFFANKLFNSKKIVKPVLKKEVKIIQTDTLVNGTVPIIIDASGNLTATRRIALFSEVTGVFKRTGKPFKKGQAYKEGETIVILDNSEFYAQVQSARSGLNNQIAALMPDLRLDYPESYPQWQRYIDAFSINTTTPALPVPKTEKEKYVITARNIYATYYNIKNLEGRLVKFRIAAQFSGVLTEALITEGTLVQPGQQLGEFIQTGSYEIEVAISSNYADLLQLGEEVRLTNTIGNKSYTGKVARVNAKVDAASQSLAVVIAASHPDLKEGMYLKAALDADAIENAVQLERNLLQTGNQLFIVEKGQLRLLAVDPVYFTDKTVVLKGIPNGTVIMSKTIPGAYEGLAVKTETQVARQLKEAQATNKKPSK
jgi:multidrug efflux pump subunit AcrA (membrane-fusion protein)